MLFFCLITGVSGIVGMTIGFPLLGMLFFRVKKGPASANTEPKSISVLIPAHNEENTLPETLRSILAALKSNNIDYRIIVGADGCSDSTKNVAESFGAEVLEEVSSIGKWSMLKKLIKKSEEKEWVALVDAGSVWPENLISEAVTYMKDGAVSGIAPGYGNPRAGAIEELLWKVERFLKGLEDRAGGPVAIHGATVLYRAEPLKDALNFLADQNWLNDDVILPLTLRALHPKLTIKYLPNTIVTDQVDIKVIESPSSGIRRRKRLVLGNLQWINRVWAPLALRSPSVAILAMRRIFRVFWGYWFFLGFLGLFHQFFAPTDFITLITLLIFVLILLFAGCLISSPVKNLTEALVASLLAPFLWLNEVCSRSKDVHWK